MVRTIHVRVRPIMPSSAACSRSVPVKVTERVDEHCGEEE